MKPLVLLLVLAVASPAVAQGPLATSARQEAARLADQQYAYGHYENVPIKSPTFVWIGIGLVAIGIAAALASTTWEQRSDLSQEDINTRVNRDIAPCGSDPDTTVLPIADCEVNTPLLAIGLGVAGAGGALILYGSQPVSHSPAIRFTVKF